MQLQTMDRDELVRRVHESISNILRDLPNPVTFYDILPEVEVTDAPENMKRLRFSIYVTLPAPNHPTPRGDA